MKITSESKNRIDKFELLRIIAAFAIMFNHINADFSIDSNSIIVEKMNFYVLSFFHIGGKFGALLFVMVGCYFLCDIRFKWKRVYRLILEVIIYAVFLDIVDIIVFHKSLTASDIVHGFSYWFPFAYIVMMLLTPLLNRIIKSVELGVVVGIGVLAGILLLVWGIVYNNTLFKIITLEQIIGSAVFCYLYVLIGLLKKRGGLIPDRKKAKKDFFLFLIFYLSMYLVVLFTDISLFRDLYSPICLLTAYLLFSVFVNMSDVSIKGIIHISSATFGMYLVQCHNNTANIWRYEVFKYDTFIKSIWFIPICFASVIIIALIAIIINHFIKRVL